MHNSELLDADGNLRPSHVWFTYLWVHHPDVVNREYVTARHRVAINNEMREKPQMPEHRAIRMEASIFWRKFVHKHSEHLDPEVREKIGRDYKKARQYVEAGRDPMTIWEVQALAVQEVSVPAAAPPLEFDSPGVNTIMDIVEQLRRQRLADAQERSNQIPYQVAVYEDSGDENGDHEVDSRIRAVLEDYMNSGHQEEEDFLEAQRASILEAENKAKKVARSSNISVPTAEPNEEKVNEEELNPEQRKRLCITCTERFIATMFWPCKHMVLCVTCSLKHHELCVEHECPICRVPYESIVKPHMAL